MKFRIDEIEIKNLDHLGIVAGIIDEIGILPSRSKSIEKDIITKKGRKK